MTERTTRTSVTFSHPFSLAGIDGVQHAGTYRIEAVEVRTRQHVVYRLPPSFDNDRNSGDEQRQLAKAGSHY